MSVSIEELKQSLRQHNEIFENLLQLIPARYYLSQEPTEEELSNKYMKNKKKQDKTKQAVKEASKKALRDKLDPSKQKTVLDIQREAAELASSGSSSKHAASSSGDFKGKGRARPPAVEEGNGDDGEELIEQGDKDVASDMDVDGHPSAFKPVPMQSNTSIQDLRARLHARMASLRRGRGGYGNGNAGSGEVEEPAEGGRDALLEERRLHRAGLRENRRQKRREQKKEEAGLKQKKKSDGRDGQRTAKVELVVPGPGPSRAEGSRTTNVEFSALTSGPSAPAHARQNNHLVTSSDPRAALAQLNARNAKLAQMSPEKRAQIEEQDRLATAEIRAAGGKVLDDASRLKKAIKRQEGEKFKSKKAWNERKEEIVKKQAIQQKKRNDNIAARNERRKDKKAGIKPKAKKSRPGFEGKSFGAPSHSSKGKSRGK